MDEDKKALLAKYNDLRVAHGLPRFSVWTSSIEALQSEVNRMSPSTAPKKAAAAPDMAAKSDTKKSLKEKKAADKAAEKEAAAKAKADAQAHAEAVKAVSGKRKAPASKASKPAEKPAAKAPASKPTPAKPSKPAPAKPSEGDSVSLASICKRLGVEPRAARIKLRKADKEGGVPSTVGEIWAWAPKDVKAVEALIKG